jgi:hypothetical protein
VNINNAFPSKYLKSGDLADGDLVMTIASVTEETVGQDENAETKPIVHFSETDKGMVLNKTNALTISNLYGPETDNWTGKKIQLFATEVGFQGKQTLAIRVRIKAPVTAPASNAPQVELPNEEAWDKWYGLLERAAAVAIMDTDDPPEDISLAGLRKLYSKLMARVKSAEAANIQPEDTPAE